ncbi:MAG TPA: VWA domain-containing protein [Gaiellaceae bacterium]|nr:VWA domain-containing protein [Gaiellaceae bacterium]
MSLGFLTPLGAAFALAALVPLAVLVLRERRARRARAALGLEQPRLLAHLPLAVALAAVPALLALAAAQPVIETTRTVRERTDAEAFVVVDVSRSMLAAAEDGGPMRIDRARLEAERVRDALPEVPVGILSLTDRLLPHLFPTTDRAVFRSTLAKAIGVERPPPALVFSTRATSLGELAEIPRRELFSRSAKKRLLVVLSDGESQPVEDSLRAAFARPPRIETLFVQLWRGGERIYEAGVPERSYTPDAASSAALARVASLVDGRVFGEGSTGAAAAAVEALGEGPTRERVLEGERTALMPYATLLALLPLGFVLLRRNL